MRSRTVTYEPARLEIFISFAALHDRHHLVQHVFRIALRNAHLERLQSGAHACDRAVMIGALHVDGAAIAALPLRDVIRDVGHEVREVAALRGALAHHAVLVVTELGGAQEQRAVFLERMSDSARVPRRFSRRVRLVQRTLEIVGVELDAECLHVEVLLVTQRGDGERAHARRDHLRPCQPETAARIPVRSREYIRRGSRLRESRAAGRRSHAHAPVHSSRDSRSARRCRCSRTRGQLANPRIEQRADGIAERGLASVSNVERSGRIGRDELHARRVRRDRARCGPSCPGHSRIASRPRA